VVEIAKLLLRIRCADGLFTDLFEFCKFLNVADCVRHVPGIIIRKQCELLQS